MYRVMGLTAGQMLAWVLGKDRSGVGFFRGGMGIHVAMIGKCTDHMQAVDSSLEY